MGDGVVVMMCVDEVCILYYNYTVCCLDIMSYCTMHSKLLLTVRCESLTNPDNGMINCSLGDDEVPSYEDTCSFTCNNGYELTGSDPRTCQSDGSWSGSDDVCRKGMVITLCAVKFCKCGYQYIYY